MLHATNPQHCSSEPARFVEKLQDTYFRLRGPLTLKCKFTGSQRICVTWKKDGKLIWASYKYNVKTTDDSCVLEVLSSDREEAVGKYSCEICNAGGTDICHANVKLGKRGAAHPQQGFSFSCNKPNFYCFYHRTPPLLMDFLEPVCFLRKLQNGFYKIGRPLTLECTFAGSQRMNVSWTKDSKLIWASYKYNVKTTDFSSYWTFSTVTVGKYTCEISNSEGTDICHALVQKEKSTSSSWSVVTCKTCNEHHRCLS